MTEIRLKLLQLLADGYSPKEIAGMVFRSESNAKFHIQELKKNLGARTTAHAVAEGLRKGLIK